METTQMNNITANAREFAKDVEESRTVTFIASTDTKDRHGTVLNQKNWNLDNFNRNPIIGYQHNVYGAGMCNEPNPDSQLGTAKAYYETVKRDNKSVQQLMVDITFEPADINPLAEKIFRKVMHGSLRAVSVGFIPIEDENGKLGEERDGAFHYFGQELLEVSVVNIPSNPDAVKRTFREDTTSALMYLHKSLDKPFSEIENMKVRDILDLLDGKKVETKDKSIEEPIKNIEEKEELQENTKNNDGMDTSFARRKLTLQSKGVK